MSSHDYVIANDTGANVRADLNLAFLADQSQNSGTSEPSTTYAYQWWADTTTGLLKQRNAANNAWISILTMSTGAVATATSATTATTASSLTLGSDAAGDIAYRGASDYDRLAKGTAGQVLKMNSGATAPEWGSDSVDLTADQSWSGSQRGTPSVVTDGTLDLNTANNFQYTPASSPDTLEFTNETIGQSGFIQVINASGHTIALGSEVRKGASWDVSTAGTYLVTYYCDGTLVWLSASEALVA